MKYSYSQDSSAAKSGIPLGGIGTGGVEYRPDGRFYEWNIFNNKPFCLTGPEEPGMGPKDAYFAIRTRGTVARPQVRILSAAESCHETDPYIYSWLRYVKGMDYDGRFPFANVRFIDENLPVSIKMEAFTPFIPHDLNNSSLPVAAFTFDVRNTADEEIDVSMLFFVKNAALYDQPNRKPFIKEQSCDGVATLVMGADGDANCPTFGTMALGCDADNVETFTGYRFDRGWFEQYSEDSNFWFGFRKTGSVPQGVENRAEAGVVNCTFKIGPGERKRTTFYLGWHFPNLIGRAPYGDYVGHFYNTFLSDAGEAVGYLKSNMRSLHRRSKAFNNAVFRSSVRDWFAEPMIGQLTTLIKSAWLGEKREFAVWEGLGCCGLQTTDVGFYGSIPIALMFQELEKNQMRMTARFPAKDGRVPHLFPGTLADVDEPGYARIDMIPQWVLMLYRDYLWFGDRELLADTWQFTKNALECLHKLDEDGDGLPNNKGTDQTYDVWKFFGSSAYVCGLYISALAAAVEMARAMGEDETADIYSQRLEKASKSYEDELWNGKYYILWNDAAKNEKDEGVMAGAMDGQWYAHLTDMGYVIPEDKVKSHLEAVMLHNFHPEHGLLNGAYPPGTKVPEQAYKSFQVPCPWTGTEYAVASHLLEESMYQEAISVVMAVDERYWERGLYWNHEECGWHYYRALVSWALLLSFSGQRYDANKQKLTMSPALPECKLPLVLPGFFGEFTAEQNVVVKPIWGELNISTLLLGNIGGSISSVRLGGKDIAYTTREDNGRTEIVFQKPIRVSGRTALELIME